VSELEGIDRAVCVRERDRQKTCVLDVGVGVGECGRERERKSLQKRIVLFSDTKSNQLENNPTVFLLFSGAKKQVKVKKERKKE